MRIVGQQTILMKYALFVRQNLKLTSAANYRWRFKVYLVCGLSADNKSPNRGKGKEREIRPTSL